MLFFTFLKFQTYICYYSEGARTPKPGRSFLTALGERTVFLVLVERVEALRSFSCDTE